MSYRSLLANAALALIYFGTARLGLSLAAVHGIATTVWPPTGLALAALVLMGMHLWPGVACGALAVNLAIGAPWWVAVGIGAGNTLEAVCGAALLRRIGTRAALDRVRDVLGLALLAAGVSTTISATIGVSSATIGGVIPPADVGRAWFTWWLGDAIGALVVAPVLLTWGARPLRQNVRRPSETAALFALMSITGAAVFNHSGAVPQLAYVVFPFVVWAALRLGQPVVTVVVLLAAAMAISGTVQGAGPFSETTLLQSLSHLQLFMAVVAITALVLGAVITERERAEEELRTSEERFRAMAETVPDMLFTCRADGASDYANPRFYEFTGLSLGAAEGDGWMLALHPDDRERCAALWHGCVVEGAPFEMKYRIRATDGSYRWFMARARVVRNRTGQIIKWMGACTDIDEQEHTEERLKREAQRKDDFLATLAHELRNPLAPIRTAVEVLQRDAVSDAIAGQARNIIARQVLHMTRLVDDLLDVARISHGKILLRNETVDLVQVVRATSEDHQRLLQASGLQLGLDVPDRSVWTIGDGTRLSQVVGNLLQNAAKFTDPGGTVTVRLHAEPDGSTAVIAVSDTGIGLAPHMAEEVFDTFSQVDHSVGRSRGGLGLGLALVKGLVALHGGDVGARSEGVGHGAEFTIRLPLHGAPAPASTRRTEPAPQSQRRVLVIDDNIDAADSLRSLLELNGHQVAVAYSGAHGLQMAQQFRPEVVLCDIGLPGEMDGYAIARALRRDAVLQKIALIAVTGYGQDEDYRRARAAGFDVHLTKPVDPARLEALVRGPW